MLKNSTYLRCFYFICKHDIIVVILNLLSAYSLIFHSQEIIVLNILTLKSAMFTFISTSDQLLNRAWKLIYRYLDDTLTWFAQLLFGLNFWIVRYRLCLIILKLIMFYAYQSLLSDGIAIKYQLFNCVLPVALFSIRWLSVHKFVYCAYVGFKLQRSVRSQHLHLLVVHGLLDDKAFNRRSIVLRTQC